MGYGLQAAWREATGSVAGSLARGRGRAAAQHGAAVALPMLGVATAAPVAVASAHSAASGALAARLGKARGKGFVLDLLVCLLLPFMVNLLRRHGMRAGEGLLRVLAERLQLLLSPLQRLIPAREYRVDIESDRAWTSDGGSSVGSKEHNAALQLAVSLYIGQLPSVRYQQAEVSLLPPSSATRPKQQGAAAGGQGGGPGGGGGKGGGRWGWQPGPAAAAAAPQDILSAKSVVRVPAPDVWVEVETGLWFRRTVAKLDDGGHGESRVRVDGAVAPVYRTVMSLRAQGGDAEKRVMTFLRDAVEWYREKLRAEEDRGRYHYVLSSGGGPEARGKWKRYPLSGSKGFGSYFVPGKDELLRVVDNFLHKRDKFANPSFPHKLGLLLHGPPGTGKTSFIKCLAAYTKRHVISIPLARIQTNQELMDIVFDLQYHVAGEPVPQQLSYEDVVFVVEDIDCACEAALTRSPHEAPAQQGQGDALRRLIDGPPPADKLNLAGLLNVLDGVVETPGRILVMTTNHAERLDPALVRPGRVNCKVLLGPIAPEQACDMVDHYFGPGEAGRAGVAAAVPPGRFTPAELEQLCAEHESAPALAARLAELAAAPPPELCSTPAAPPPAPPAESTAGAAAPPEGGDAALLERVEGAVAAVRRCASCPFAASDGSHCCAACARSAGEHTRDCRKEPAAQRARQAAREVARAHALAVLGADAAEEAAGAEPEGAERRRWREEGSGGKGGRRKGGPRRAELSTP
eukprot:TRINITY_DN1558_c0_g2_i1.p1 TRINITY_DN1558_c0_g2~~TRINITY_DN1558_c0_g2_i1.p1  ORF type:complete len:746 (+),score=246.97 TRINITY_DN1558_c0_g2_i1:109-2346(+)